MKTTPTLLYAAAVLCAACGPKRGTATVTPTTGPQAPKVIAPSMTPASIAARWLWYDCSVGDGQQLPTQVVRAAASIESLFMAAYRDGPADKDLAEVEGALRARFAARNATLASDIGLGKEELDRARKTTEKAFVVRGLADAVAGYRSQALLGLGLVGSDSARATLTGVASDPASPFKSTAARALGSNK